MKTIITLIFTLATALHAVQLTNPITADGTYTVPTYAGKRYVVAVSGDFGGGSLAINWNDGAGNQTAYPNSPATAGETWTFTAASNQVDLVLTGATSPSLTVNITLGSGNGNIADAGIEDITGLQPALDGKLAANNSAVIGVLDDDPIAVRNAVGSDSDRPKLANTIARITGEFGENRVPPTISVVSMGDSYSIDFTDTINDLGVQQGYGSMATSTVFTPNTMSGTDATRHFGGSTVITSGQTATMVTGQLALRAHLFYAMENGYGTFRVEQQIGSGSWTDLTTGQATAASPVVTDNGGSPDCGVLTINWGNTSTDARKLRIIHVSGGTVRLIGVHMTATPAVGSSFTNGGAEWFSLGLGGLIVAHQSDVPQVIYDAVFGTLRPHIVTYKNDDAEVSMAGVADIVTKVQNATKYDSTLVACSAVTGAGTLALGLVMDEIQVNETAVGDEAMVQGRYYKIDSVGTTDFTLLGAASNTAGIIFRKNAVATYGTGTVFRMTYDSDVRTVNYSVAGAMTGPDLAAGVKATLEGVPNFSTHYTAAVQHDRVLVKAKVAGQKFVLNIATSGLSGVGMPNAVFSDYRRACKPDFVLVGSHPVNVNQSRELTAADLVLKNLALTTHNIFVDCRKSFPPYADMVANYNMISDGYHLTPTTGKSYEARLVMKEITETLRAGAFWNSATSSARMPGYAVNSLGVIAPFSSGSSKVFDVVARTNASTGRRNAFSLWRNNTDSSVTISPGATAARVKMADGGAVCMVVGGLFGMSAPQDNACRLSNGAVEILASNPAGSGIGLNLSSMTGHTGDVLRVSKDAAITAGTVGTRVAGISATGNAEFASARVTPTTVAGLASLPQVSGTESYVTDGSVAHATNSGTVVTGGGSNFLPVYFDGTNWRIK